MNTVCKPGCRIHNHLTCPAGPAPFPPQCTCARHRGVPGSGRKPCPPGCDCGQHTRTAEHNARISISVKLTHTAKQRTDAR